jgi:SNF2 family DNA or RNA helicase
LRTYGTLHFKEGRFLIQCEAHVVMRLKRVFGKIDKRQHGVIYVAATEETARDLEWFMDRFPLEVVDDASHELKARADRHRERTAAVDAILSGRIEVADFGLAMPLREYQEVAAEIAFQRNSLLLADDVGLGKTASAIGLMARSVTLPALVVTLTHLPRQWRDELGKFAPHLSTHIIKTGKPYDVLEKHCRGKRGPKVLPDVIIISYSKLSKWADTLAPLIRTVVYDEVQELRRSGSDKAAAARHISGATTWRMGLSATPIYNYGSEIWNVMQSIAPDSIGTWNEFLNEWCTAVFGNQLDKAKIKDPKAFGSYMRESGLMLRRTRKDVGRELLPLNKCVEHIDADMKALESVTFSCAELAKSILHHGEAYRGQKMQQSEEFSNLLRQATGIAKAPFVAEYVRLLLEGEERVVIYGWHREVYSIWMDRLKEFKPVLYTGSESPTQKDAAKEAFMKGESRVLIISLRAGAGLDGLQFGCRTLVFGELDWSPGVHEQCEGRILRDGQKEPVFAYYLVADSGSDPTVAQVLGVKKQQISGIRHDGEGELFQELQNDGNRIKDLARDFLARNSEAVIEGEAVGA